MESSQSKFILDQLNSYKLCEIQEKYIDKISEVSISVISKILNQKFTSGPDMKAVICLFDTLFLSSMKTNTREKGLYNLSKHIQKVITKMTKLPICSREAFIYITDIFSEDIHVIIKVPRKDSGYDSLIREYFMGIKSINKLRYLVPNFVYTLGAFLCPKPTKNGKLCVGRSKKTAFVIYERIQGDSVESLLENEDIDFDQWLLILAQLLLGLEVAQREIRFTHFDMHPGNIMLRKKDNLSYIIPLDNISYHINEPDLIPVVIDFGTSSVYTDIHYIGSYDYRQHGMLNFMVPGYDMYKFIIYSISSATNPTLKNKITQLFRFYGCDDPYDIINQGISVAVNQYCREVTFSNVATYTPLMMLNWICKEYNGIINTKITVMDRLQYIPIQYSNTLKEYDAIFEHNKEGIDNAVKLANECINQKPSYVMTEYNIHILEKYNEKLMSTELSYHIKKLKRYLNSSKDLLLTVDLSMLEKIFDVQIPMQESLTIVVDNVLGIQIRHSDALNKRKAVSDLDILVYQEKLIPYLQFFFTILELNLQHNFTDWISRFKDSGIYILYINNINQNERAIRWGQTLIASLL